MQTSSNPQGMLSNQLQELDARAVNKFAHFVKPSPPAIPKKEQSYGYIQVGSDLRAQPQPANIYSGLGQDTVGPAAYNSHHPIWNERKNVAPSLRSTVKREVWEENASHSSVPGPGHYYEDSVASATGPGSESAAAARKGGLRGRKKHGNHERQSAVFASKVPILPDPKPRTQYDSELAMEINAKESRLRYQLERQKTNILKAKIEAFGSTTGRVELSSQLNAPFSNPSFTMTPGPGMYSDRTHGGLRGPKKHRPPAASNREESMGFSSATERYCLSKSKKPAAPGPGTYKSETPRSLDHAVKSKSAIGRNGIFGSTSERHVWEQLSRIEAADDFTPGPGAYEKPVETHAGHFPHAANSATFKSNSLRFSKQNNPHAPPHVHCVGNHVAPAVGQYDISASLDVGGSGSSPGKPGCTSPPTSARGGAVFLSKCERAVFDTKDVRDLPGPGAYDADEDNLRTGNGGTLNGMSSSTAKQTMTRFHEIRSSIGNEERFRIKPTVPENVGPGAYSIPGTVGSKSFNVTMKASSVQAVPQRYRQC